MNDCKKWRKLIIKKGNKMYKIETLKTRELAKSLENGGCGECQTSCQSASKTSCSVTNQKCESKEKNNN
jgi:predicted ribosomally synthesized six-cysteine peptide SCIFF